MEDTETGLRRSRNIYLVRENIPPLAKQFQALSLRNHNRVLSQLVGEITLRGIRFQLGQDVPDSGQEHPTHGDDCFLVPAAGLDSAVALFAFGVLVRFDNGICHLNQQRFQIAASA